MSDIDDDRKRSETRRRGGDKLANSNIVALVPRPASETQALRPRRQDGTQEEAAVRRIRLPSAETRPRQAAYETVRVIDLSRLRVALRRESATRARKGPDAAPMPPERADILAALDALHAERAAHWPDVVVMRRPAGEIQTRFAVMGRTIYLGAHLSASWTEGKEDMAVFRALADALTVLARARASQFETFAPDL